MFKTLENLFVWGTLGCWVSTHKMMSMRFQLFLALFATCQSLLLTGRYVGSVKSLWISKVLRKTALVELRARRGLNDDEDNIIDAEVIRRPTPRKPYSPEQGKAREVSDNGSPKSTDSGSKSVNTIVDSAKAVFNGLKSLFKKKESNGNIYDNSKSPNRGVGGSRFVDIRDQLDRPASNSFVESVAQGLFKAVLGSLANTIENEDLDFSFGGMFSADADVPRAMEAAYEIITRNSACNEYIGRPMQSMEPYSTSTSFAFINGNRLKRISLAYAVSGPRGSGDVQLQISVPNDNKVVVDLLVVSLPSGRIIRL